MQNLGQKAPILGNLRGTSKILTTHDLLCRKFATSVGILSKICSCEKTATPALPTFLTYDATVDTERCKAVTHFIIIGNVTQTKISHKILT